MKTKRTVGFYVGKNYLSWLLYGGLALAFMLMQSDPRFFPPIFFARPAPLVLFAVCAAFFEGPKIGALIGVFSGLLWDLHAFRVFGLNAMILLIISVTVGLLVQWLMRANFLSGMLLCCGGVIVQSLLEWILCYALFLDPESGVVLLHVYLPNMLYTILLSPLMYGVVFWTARFLRRRQMK